MLYEKISAISLQNETPRYVGCDVVYRDPQAEDSDGGNLNAKILQQGGSRGTHVVIKLGRNGRTS